MDKKSCIYKIINRINNKIYIGSTYNIVKRKNIHIYLLKNNKHHSILLQRAFNKYGESNFKFEILETVEDRSKLIEREQYYLDTLLFASENNDNFKLRGYNISRIASVVSTNKGRKKPVGFGELVSKRQLGSKRTLEQNKQNSLRQIGITKIKKFKPVVKLTLSGEFIEEFKSILEASNYTNTSYSGIGECCRGNFNNSGGFKWMYKGDYREGIAILNKPRSNNFNYKLTLEEIDSIIDMLNNKVSQCKIAKNFKVSQGTISSIKLNKEGFILKRTGK